MAYPLYLISTQIYRIRECRQVNLQILLRIECAPVCLVIWFGFSSTWEGGDMARRQEDDEPSQLLKTNSSLLFEEENNTMGGSCSKLPGPLPRLLTVFDGFDQAGRTSLSYLALLTRMIRTPQHDPIKMIRNSKKSYSSGPGDPNGVFLEDKNIHV